MRALKRLTIRLRWPAAIAALVILLAAGVSFARAFGVTIVGFGHAWRVTLRFAALSAVQLDSRMYLDADSLPPLQWEWRATTSGEWEQLSAEPLAVLALVPRASGPQAFSDWHILVPAWCLLLPPALLAFAGFRLHRRAPAPGRCPRCRHLLAGAAVCPECGTPTPATAP